MIEMEALVKSVKEVVTKVEEQNEVIGLLQTQVEFQNDRITAQEKIISELTAKLEALANKVVEDHVCTEISPKTPQSFSKDDDGWNEKSDLSIADQAKEIAEKTLMTNLGFIFDPKTKLYCNYSTGYYYDPAQELYYNGHTGTYYTFDEQSQEYRFHSQIEVPATTQAQQKTKECTKSEASRKRSNGNRRSVDRFATNEGERERKKVLKVRRPILTTPSSKQTNKTEMTENDSERDAVATRDEKCVEIEDEEDPEEGELSESSKSEVDDEGESESDDSCGDNNGENNTNNAVENNEQYPPCIRCIITESSSEEIKKGSLYLVTCMGGTIGREGYEHALMLPHPLVEKTHARIQYMTDPASEDNAEKYFITDLGSRSGTFLNSKRLSNEKEKSDPYEILHGSLLKIAEFTILMHIHPGSFTCGHCEPGLLMTENDTAISNKSPGVLAPEPASRQVMMRRIRKKYGIERPLKSGELLDADNYKDRAQERRVVKGSDNPFEKTQVAALETPISETNKGFAMLKKMGWNKGNSLGQSTQGMVEPISLEPKNNRGGLGLASHLIPSTPSQLSSDRDEQCSDHSKNHRIKKSDRIAITMRRFKEAERQSANQD